MPHSSKMFILADDASAEFADFALRRAVLVLLGALSLCLCRIVLVQHAVARLRLGGKG